MELELVEVLWLRGRLELLLEGAVPSYDMGSFTFALPDFVDEHWRDAIEASEGFERELWLSRAKIMNLRTSMPALEVTPALLAWVNLWTKCMSILEGVQMAWVGHSALTLEVLERIAVDNWLQVNAIMEPEKASPRTEKERMHSRLCAYTAWALSEDKRLNWELSKPQMLDMVWDSKPAQSIKFNPKALAFHEANIGELTIDTDPASLRIDRKKQEEQIRQERERIDAWLRHPDLKEWAKKIRDLTELMKPQSVPFFALFNIEEKSIGKRMWKAGFGLGYHVYKRSSSLIHGSTIEQFNITLQDKVIPKIFMPTEGVDDQAEMVRSTCVAAGLMLAYIQKQVWPV